MGQFTRSLHHRPFETRASTTRAHEVGKGKRRNNAPSRSPRRSGQPIIASAASRLRAFAFDRDLICGEHYGQRPWISAAQTGRTHGSTDQLCITVKKTLANRGPSTHGSAPHKQAGHMAAPTSSASPSKKPLPTGGRPHMAISGSGRRARVIWVYNHRSRSERRGIGWAMSRFHDAMCRVRPASPSTAVRAADFDDREGSSRILSVLAKLVSMIHVGCEHGVCW